MIEGAKLVGLSGECAGKSYPLMEGDQSPVGQE